MRARCRAGFGDCGNGARCGWRSCGRRKGSEGSQWNGNIDPALRLVDGLKTTLAGEGISAERQKLLRAVREFGNYIAANQACIPDYGDRYRNHETISTAFTESAVNQLVSRRMVKQQQMHWTERGAHLLLQVRVQVMNGDLRQTFGRWYPGVKTATEPLPLVA